MIVIFHQYKSVDLKVKSYIYSFQKVFKYFPAHRLGEIETFLIVGSGGDMVRILVGHNQGFAWHAYYLFIFHADAMVRGKYRRT